MALGSAFGTGLFYGSASAIQKAGPAGPLAGFITGWTFVFEMAIVAIADVTAFSIYMGFWFHGVPWMTVVMMTGVLLVRGDGRRRSVVPDETARMPVAGGAEATLVES